MEHDGVEETKVVNLISPRKARARACKKPSRLSELREATWSGEIKVHPSAIISKTASRNLLAALCASKALIDSLDS